MSIDRVEYPAAGGSAVFPDDYNLQNDLIAAIIAQGDNALKLTEWNSSGTVPAVKLGVYVRHNGTYYLVTSSNEAISGTPTTVKQNYVKLTPTGGGANLTASWVDEDGIGGYSYDFTKDGWYDGSDNQILEEFLYRDGSVYTNRKYQDRFTHNTFIAQDGKVAVDGLITKVIDIGDWDMDASVSIDIAHGIDDYYKIRDVRVMIRRDTPAAANFYPLDHLALYVAASAYIAQGGIEYINSTIIRLFRLGSGFFDSSIFDDTSYNRGWITITYEV